MRPVVWSIGLAVRVGPGRLVRGRDQVGVSPSANGVLGLTGKPVALEPATGFSFDSPLEVRR